MVPDADQPAIDLAVAAFERQTGELLAPVKTMTVALTDVVVQPASALPPLQAATAKSQLPQTREAALPGAIPVPHSIGLTAEAERQAVATRLAEAERLLERGNLAEARKAFESAWSSGAAEGALGLARSYDPVVLSSLKIKDAQPDSATALVWYEQAAQAGNAEATNAIMRLKLKP